jgi:hypothetical protein
MSEVVDKKYWVQGWWCRDYIEAIKKAEELGRWRISYTPDTPQNLKLIAVKKFGKWRTNILLIRWYENRYGDVSIRRRTN